MEGYTKILSDLKIEMFSLNYQSMSKKDYAHAVYGSNYVYM